MGGEQRGYDGGKKVRGRKRHLLVDTEGLVLKAKVHSAKVPDQDGIKLLLKAAHQRLPRRSHLWVDAGHQGSGKEWEEQELGLSVKVVHRPKKLISEKIARIWAQDGQRRVERSIGRDCSHVGASRFCRDAGPWNVSSRG